MSTEEEAAAALAKVAADADAKPVTMAELKKLLGGDKDVSTTAHQAASTHAKRLEDKFAKQRAEDAAAWEAKLTAQNEAWEARLTSLAPRPKTEPKAEPDGITPAPHHVKLEEHPDFLAMKAAAAAQQKELERLKSKQAEEQKKAADAVARERKTQLRSKTEELLARYVAPGRAAHARMLLTHTDNPRIDYAADDSEDLIFVNDDGEKVPIEKGIKAWIKSEDAKHFLPPLVPNGSGSGAGRAGGGGPNNIEDDITAIHARLARGER